MESSTRVRVLANVAGQVIRALATMGAVVVCVRFASPSVFVYFNTLLVYFAIVPVLCRFGLAQAVVRELALLRLGTAKDAATARQCVMRATAVVASNGLLVGTGVALVMSAVVPGVGWSVCLLVGMGIVAESLRLVWSEAHRSTAKALRAVYLGHALRALLLFCFVSAAARGGATTTSMTVAVVSASGVAAAASGLSIFRALPRDSSPGLASRRAGISVYLGMFALGATPLVAEFASIVISQFDMLLAGITFGASDAAEYGLAARIANLMSILPSAVVLALAPRIARLHQRGCLPQMATLVRRVAGWLTVIQLAVVGGAVVAGPSLLTPLFGDVAVEAFDYIVLLLIGFALANIFGLGPLLLIMTGQRRATVTASLVVLVLVLVVQCLSVWLGGPVELALASGFAVVANNAICWVLVKRSLGINISPIGGIHR